MISQKVPRRSQCHLLTVAPRSQLTLISLFPSWSHSSLYFCFLESLSNKLPVPCFRLCLQQNLKNKEARTRRQKFQQVLIGFERASGMYNFSKMMVSLFLLSMLSFSKVEQFNFLFGLPPVNPHNQGLVFLSLG